MLGRIKVYNSDKGFGFIVGEDNQDRFFHISSVKNIGQLNQGATVNFTSIVGEKGLVAKDIFVEERKEVPTFIQFGEVRIKISNIKTYGIGKETTYFEKEKEYEKRDRSPLQQTLTGVLKGLKFFYEATGAPGDANKKNTVIIEKESKYLYITTYQKDNYKFYDYKVDFDIDSKLQELDNFLA